MKYKFKIGDKVRVLDKNSYNLIDIGHVGVVNLIHKNNPRYPYELNNSNVCLKEEWLELIKPNKGNIKKGGFMKRIIGVGDIVMDRENKSWGTARVTEAMSGGIEVVWNDGETGYYSHKGVKDLVLVKPNNRGKNPRGKDGRFIKCQQKGVKPLHSKKDVKNMVYTILSWYLPADTAKTACKQIMEVLV